MRVHLESAAAQGDIEAEWRLANPPPLSPHATHVWNAFADISRTRQIGGMSLCRLTRLEVRLWERDMGVDLAPWERRAIFQIDDEWLAAMTPKEKPKGHDGPGTSYIP